MKTQNPNLFFFTSLEGANKMFNSLAKPCEITESYISRFPEEREILGYYLEIRSAEKPLSEIEHNSKLIRQK